MSSPPDGEPRATLVANRLRVAVVECLAARSSTDPVGLDELADLVARRCRGTDSTDSDELRVGLHHVHLQTLERAGVIDYDAASLSVQPAAPDALDTLLARFDAAEASAGSTVSAVTPDRDDQLANGSGIGASAPENDDD